MSDTESEASEDTPGDTPGDPAIYADNAVTKGEYLQRMAPTCPRLEKKRRSQCVYLSSEEARPVGLKGRLSPRYDPNIKETYLQQTFLRISKIGEGSYGAVYSVISKDDKKMYAVKIVKRYRPPNFLAEIDILDKIDGILNCMGYINAWMENNILFIQLELATSSLHTYSFKKVILEEYELYQILIDVLVALKGMHSIGLVHMDVKPDNILQRASGQYILADFGLSTFVGKEPLSFHPSEGDSKYVSSDMLRGDISPAGDIFALGITVFEVGHSIVLPEHGTDWHTYRQGKRIIFPDRVKTIPADLSYLLAMMMRKDPSERPTADKLLKHPTLQRRLYPDKSIDDILLWRQLAWLDERTLTHCINNEPLDQKLVKYTASMGQLGEYATNEGRKSWGWTFPDNAKNCNDSGNQSKSNYKAIIDNIGLEVNNFFSGSNETEMEGPSSSDECSSEASTILVENRKFSTVANAAASSSRSSTVANAVASSSRYSTVANAVASTSRNSTVANAVASTSRYSTFANAVASTSGYSTVANAVASTSRNSTVANAVASSSRYSTVANAVASTSRNSTVANAVASSSRNSTVANAVASSSRNRTRRIPNRVNVHNLEPIVSIDLTDSSSEGSIISIRSSVRGNPNTDLVSNSPLQLRSNSNADLVMNRSVQPNNPSLMPNYTESRSNGSNQGSTVQPLLRSNSNSDLITNRSAESNNPLPITNNIENRSNGLNERSTIQSPLRSSSNADIATNRMVESDNPLLITNYTENRSSGYDQGPIIQSLFPNADVINRSAGSDNPLLITNYTENIPNQYNEVSTMQSLYSNADITINRSNSPLLMANYTENRSNGYNQESTFQSMFSNADLVMNRSVGPNNPLLITNYTENRPNGYNQESVMQSHYPNPIDMTITDYTENRYNPLLTTNYTQNMQPLYSNGYNQEPTMQPLYSNADFRSVRSNNQGSAIETLFPNGDLVMNRSVTSNNPSLISNYTENRSNVYNQESTIQSVLRDNPNAYRVTNRLVEYGGPSHIMNYSEYGFSQRSPIQSTSNADHTNTSFESNNPSPRRNCSENGSNQESIIRSHANADFIWNRSGGYNGPSQMSNYSDNGSNQGSIIQSPSRSQSNDDFITNRSVRSNSTPLMSDYSDNESNQESIQTPSRNNSNSDISNRSVNYRAPLESYFSDNGSNQGSIIQSPSRSHSNDDFNTNRSVRSNNTPLMSDYWDNGSNQESIQTQARSSSSSDISNRAVNYSPSLMSNYSDNGSTQGSIIQSPSRNNSNISVIYSPPAMSDYGDIGSNQGSIIQVPSRSNSNDDFILNTSVETNCSENGSNQGSAIQSLLRSNSNTDFIMKRFVESSNNPLLNYKYMNIYAEKRDNQGPAMQSNTAQVRSKPSTSQEIFFISDSSDSSKTPEKRKRILEEVDEFFSERVRALSPSTAEAIIVNIKSKCSKSDAEQSSSSKTPTKTLLEDVDNYPSQRKRRVVRQLNLGEEPDKTPKRILPESSRTKSDITSTRLNFNDVFDDDDEN